VERHEILRTICPEEGGVAHQRILGEGEWRLGVDIAEVREEELAGALAGAARQGFDLARSLPVRGYVYRLGCDAHVLLLVLHHIAADGWSLGPLFRDLGAFYGARLRGEGSGLSGLSVQYADYTLWQREVLGEESEAGSAITRQLSSWRERLSGLPEGIELAGDRVRP